MLGEYNTAVQGRLFNIQRYNLHDGDGIRTIVFFKGCSLRCRWCANPEGLRPLPQLRVLPQKCVNCGKCTEWCDHKACEMLDNRMSMHWDRCSSCGKCVNACIFGAREMLGRCMSAEEIMEEVRKDFSFYRRSGGGLTLSGGEALLQADFASTLLRMACAEGVHTAVETCGCVPWEAFEAVIEHTGLFFFDLKHMDCNRHRQLTGTGNELILENARKLSERKKRIIFRMPVIPGLNDSESNVAQTARFAAELGAEKLELLPYHTLGMGKYAQLGMEYSLSDLRPPEEKHMEHLRMIVGKNWLCEKTGQM